ncbi:hypothetical protein D3C81_1859070 [compost metagenome]
MLVQLIEGHRLAAFPGDADAFVGCLDAEGFGILQVAFAVVGHQFVEGDAVRRAVHFDDIALEALLAIGEGDHQGIVAIHQHLQAGVDFHGGRQGPGRLRAVFPGEGTGHDRKLSILSAFVRGPDRYFRPG